MPGTVMFNGPIPPAGQQFCTLCAASYKASGLAALAPQIKAIQDSGDTGWLTLAKAVTGRPAPAVAMGMVVLPAPPSMGQGQIPALAPLCWSHLQAISLLESALQPATAAQMPGSGGAVLLR